VRSALVTGASTGIGCACAERLARAGWHVYAGVRSRGDAPHGTTELILDVTDDEAIARAAQRVEELHGLVNNAGIAVGGPLEYLPIAELRRQLEVNVLGQLAVTQAVLPKLRAGRGRIVFMGSIAGRSSLPFLGAYAISKFGLEAMADALRVEVAPWGMHVSIVEPGTIATPIWTKPQPVADAIDRDGLALYGARLDAFRRAAADRAAHGIPPDEVAKAVEHALASQRPRTRYLVGPDARRRALLQRLPDRLRDRILERAIFSS
jgi:NAD(P)-dependent dehydrogenase (short-subunit alcohol dehydrogenase family)